MTETHHGAIRSTVYLTEIHEGTGGIESDLNELNNQEEQELVTESQGDIFNITKGKSLPGVEKQAGILRGQPSSIKFNNLLKKSESGIEGSTAYNVYSNDGDGTTPIDSVVRQNYEFVSPTT